MDALGAFFGSLKKKDLAKGHFLGFLHVMIGRRLKHNDGTLVSPGLTWRELASQLKKIRWEPEVVRELGIDPEELPARDRLRYWYQAITRAGVDSAEASAAGDKFARRLRQIGYHVEE